MYWAKNNVEQKKETLTMSLTSVFSEALQVSPLVWGHTRRKWAHCRVHRIDIPGFVDSITRFGTFVELRTWNNCL